MKIQFLKENALERLKTNIEANIDKYSESSNSWIYEYFGDENPFMDYKKEVGEIKLNMSAEKPETTDIENAKILYLALKDIDNSQASDERLWAGLAHGQLWEYARYRCKTMGSDISTDSIKSNYFFKQNPHRAVIRNVISRLWWVGRLTYDENNKTDPFYAIQWFSGDFHSKVTSLFSSNFSSNIHITLAYLKAVIDIENKGEKVNREVYRELVRYLNLIGGTFILDYLSEDEIKLKIVNYYYSTVKPSLQKKMLTQV